LFVSLKILKVTILPYDAIYETINGFSNIKNEPKQKILVSKTCNLALVKDLQGIEIEEGLSPISLAKGNVKILKKRKREGENKLIKISSQK